MKKLSIRIIIMLSIMWLLISCRSCYENTTPSSHSSEDGEKYLCPALPSTFKESDLIGSWVANYHLDDKDLLIFKEDGTYKQIYSDPNPSPNESIHYESDWQKWWLEYRDSGYIRLHLKGMRRCDGIELFCQREVGGIDPELVWAIDYCEDEIVEMPDEVVLIVTGSKEKVPRGIILRQTRLAGSEWTWSFRLQDESTNP
ncbi:MAG: hypothetical protein JXA13_02805 [Anaerolineales bacterium]|nr:hypothetical protein [Anaerolineales bacterium]